MRPRLYLLLTIAALLCVNSPAQQATVHLASDAASPAPKAASPKPESAPQPAQATILDFDGHVAKIISLDQLDCVENEFSRRFRYDKFDNPKLKLLRESEKLAELVKTAKDEFEAQKLLLGWTQKRITRFGEPTSEATGALDILTAVDAGQTFYCKHFASVYVSAAASLGYVARPLALKRANDGPGFDEHAVVEIWSNQYKKWVMMDPTFAAYITGEDAQPLSAWEVRQAWFNNAGKGLKIHFVSPGKETQIKNVSELPVAVGTYPDYGKLSFDANTLNTLALIGYIPNTDLMDSEYDYKNMFISRDELAKDVKWHTRDNPKNPASEPYFPLCQAAMFLKSAAGGISVELNTNTPNFDHYEFRIDSGGWKTGRPESWSPDSGTHTLEVVAVNRFGIRGSVSRLVIEVSPAKPSAEKDK